MRNFLAFGYAFIMWHLRGLPLGLRQSIGEMPRAFRQKAWIESYFEALPKLRSGVGDRSKFDFTSVPRRKVFGGLHMRVATANFVVDYVLFRTKSLHARDVFWMTHMPFTADAE